MKVWSPNLQNWLSCLGRQIIKGGEEGRKRERGENGGQGRKEKGGKKKMGREGKGRMVP